jgi:hypothetical protein
VRQPGVRRDLRDGTVDRRRVDLGRRLALHDRPLHRHQRLEVPNVHQRLEPARADRLDDRDDHGRVGGDTAVVEVVVAI